MNIKQVKQELDEYGEIVVVLESGEKYELHKHDTECDKEEGIVETEGMEDGEYRIVRFPSGTIEHFYYHREN